MLALMKVCGNVNFADDEIWYVGTLCDLEYECPNQISIFGRKPVLLAQTPFFGFFGLFKD